MGEKSSAGLTPAAARAGLAELGARLAAARAELAAATTEARRFAYLARHEAELSKVEIAETLEIQRPTLDRWLAVPPDTPRES